ncbi:transporter substrate-binding domain-containing protein [Agrobacterium sp. MCAB5]|uniref:transporter substrate-binding domain-containing protein n=1 Tax=Agrobacterium sp. MCAB5 TaxID=3233042 RepID=UPI003F9292CD
MEKIDNTRSRRGFGKLVLGATATAAYIGVQTKLASAQPSDSRIDKIKDRGVLRVAAPVGEPPYFVKDLKSGEIIGAAVEMAKDIANILKVKVQFVDSTWGDQILQLQTDKVDIGMASTHTGARALAVGFTIPYFNQGYGVVAKPNVEANSWADINKPEIRIVTDIGSTQEFAARQNAPKATITSFPTRDEVILAMQSGRADCAAFAAIPGLAALKKTPQLGRFLMLRDPMVAMPTGIVIPKETNRDWRDFLDAWIEYNKGAGQIGAWMRGGLALAGVKAEDIPPEVIF